MTIEYNVSPNGKRIEAFPKGVLDIAKTIEYFDKLQNDARVKPGAVEFVYFKNVTNFKISYSESKEITESYQKPKETQKISETVFICETDLAYGIGRMLQSFHEITNPKHKVRISRS